MRAGSARSDPSRATLPARSRCSIRRRARAARSSIDEDAQALLGRDAAGRAVRLLDQAELARARRACCGSLAEESRTGSSVRERVASRPAPPRRRRRRRPRAAPSAWRSLRAASSVRISRDRRHASNLARLRVVRQRSRNLDAVSRRGGSQPRAGHTKCVEHACRRAGSPRARERADRRRRSRRAGRLASSASIAAPKKARGGAPNSAANVRRVEAARACAAPRNIASPRAVARVEPLGRSAAPASPRLDARQPGVERAHVRAAHAERRVRPRRLASSTRPTPERRAPGAAASSAGCAATRSRAARSSRSRSARARGLEPRATPARAATRRGRRRARAAGPRAAAARTGVPGSSVSS